jgi:hypothetical protein
MPKRKREYSLHYFVKKLKSLENEIKRNRHRSRRRHRESSSSSSNSTSRTPSPSSSSSQDHAENFENGQFQSFFNNFMHFGLVHGINPPHIVSL